MRDNYEAPRLTVVSLCSDDVISTSEGIILPEVPLGNDDSW